MVCKKGLTGVIFSMLVLFDATSDLEQVDKNSFPYSPDNSQEERKTAIEKALKELDSNEPDARVAAQRALVELEAAKEVEPLTKSADVEVRTRAETIVKTVSFIRQLKLQALYKKEPDLVETLAFEEKEKWVTIIGTQLMDKPGFLTQDQSSILAQELLKEQFITKNMIDTIASCFKSSIKGTPPSGEEAWLYIESLGDKNIAKLCWFNFNESIGLICVRLLNEGKAIDWIVEGVLNKCDDYNLDVRSAAIDAISHMGWHLNEQLANQAAGKLLRFLDDKEWKIQSRAAGALIIVRLKCESQLKKDIAKAITKSFIDKISDKKVSVRITAYGLLKNIMETLKKKEMRAIAKSATSQLKTKVEQELHTLVGVFHSAMKYLDQTLVAEAISATEEAVKQVDKPLHKQWLDLLVTFLRKRQEELVQQEKERKKQIEKAIKELSDNDCNTRLAAMTKLIDLEADKEAEYLTKSTDFEVKTRAETVVKTVKFLQLFELQQVYKKEPALVEELALESDKTKWVSLIGKLLNNNPKLLSMEQKKVFADRILKEKGIRLFYPFFDTVVAKDEAKSLQLKTWLYRAALENENIEIVREACLAFERLAITKVGTTGGPSLLDAKIVKDAVKTLIVKIHSQDSATSEYASRALMSVVTQILKKDDMTKDIASSAITLLTDKDAEMCRRAANLLSCSFGYLDEKMIARAVEALVAKSSLTKEDKEKRAHGQIIKALCKAAQHLKKGQLADKLADVLLNPLKGKDTELRKCAILALGDLAPNLEGKQREKAVKYIVLNASDIALLYSYTSGVLSPTYHAGAEALQKIASILEGTLLDNAIQIVEKIKIQTVQEILVTLKKRKQELEQKK